MNKSWQNARTKWHKISIEHARTFGAKKVVVLRELQWAKITVGKPYEVIATSISYDNYDVRFVDIIDDEGTRVAIEPKDLELV